ncbi:MAG: hypothetical protein ACJ71U_15110 [Terriglobales bacterium]
MSTLRQVSGHDLSAKADASDCEQSLRSRAAKVLKARGPRQAFRVAGWRSSRSETERQKQARRNRLIVVGKSGLATLTLTLCPDTLFHGLKRLNNRPSSSHSTQTALDMGIRVNRR